MCTRWSRRLAIATRSLFLTEHMSGGYMLDTLVQPFYWLVANSLRHFGPMFIAVLLALLTTVVAIIFAIVVPNEIVAHKSVGEVLVCAVIGFYLLINSVFHYVMAWRTPAGRPPTGALVASASGICPTCISPKPPRTHHCRLCDTCILKMDHHCPWLNQCVGNDNHRYFVQCLAFMCLSCVYVVVAMWPTFYEHYWEGGGNVAQWCINMEAHLFYAEMLCFERTHVVYNFATEANAHATWWAWIVGDAEHTTVEAWHNVTHGDRAHNAIVFVYFVCVGLVFGLGGLLSWHCWLISYGETSIEQHINATMRSKCTQDGTVYRNPYDHGWRDNWRILLGVESGRSWWRHVLLPSRHAPASDGLVFQTDVERKMV